MTGLQFERWMCKILKYLGYWALNISKDARGAQPFDILAIKGKEIIAIDCKVCGSNRFQIRRIEDNQWTAFETVSKKVDAMIGIMIWYDGQVYYYSFGELKARSNMLKEKTVPLDESHIWMNMNQVEEAEYELCKR